MPIKRAIFARIGYMKYYSGSQEGDERPRHGGAYNKKKVGHEVYNFKNIQGELFGAFTPYKARKGSGNRTTINLERVDPSTKNEEFLNDVLVIFVATSEEYGQVIVGWYGNATVYRNYQESDERMLRERMSYNLRAKIKTSVLIPENYRRFNVPKGAGAFGRANVVYLTESNGNKRDLRSSKFNWIKKAIDYVNDYDGPNLLFTTSANVESDIEDIIENEKITRSGQGIKITPELRKEIEEYSVKKAIEYFKNQEYSVRDVGAFKPYDLECKKRGATLIVEVKGTQTSGDSVILTRNEVMNAEKTRSALYILHSIKVETKGRSYQLSGGEEKVYDPWKISKHGELKPLSYNYLLNQSKE